ncbi:MAG: FAD-dependent oxidoreductase [Deltaproteobacteria bacterium]|nr:FAD-dependent oxidoreductase [Deltaproteobacteria bacterium]
MAEKLPTHAQAVIIGGGIVGCSVAYHLCKLGWKDVVVLERKSIASGTTWAAAGLMGQLWSNAALTRLAVYGSDLYARLEEETGQPTGYLRSGSIRVAQTKARKEEYDRSMQMARAFGIEMEEISLEEAKKMFPLLHTDDLEAAWFQPNDGHANPEDTTQALAKGARTGGAKIIENVKVIDIDFQQGIISGVNTVKGVKTDKGDIACEYLVNCAGMWSHILGKRLGMNFPLYAAEHMHMTTNPIEGTYKGMPYIRDMDGYIYIKEEMGGLLMGGFEPVAKPWGMQGIPDDFKYTQLQEDWDQFEIFMNTAVIRVPAFEDAEVNSLTTVPESFTPDTAYMLGEMPGVKNFFVATGMNSVGITSAGGAGWALAQWMDQGYPEADLWAVDVRRFYGWQKNSRYLHDRIVEAVGNLYADHWPFKQPETARNVRQTPFHDRLEARGACFGVVAGWERANWFAPEGVKAEYEYSWGRQNWFEYSAAEHMAIRENVGVYDLSSMAKFLVQGRDALKTLQYVCCNDVDVAVGKVVYTQMLNERGGIEADITVTRLAEDKFFIVSPGACGVRDFDYINRHIGEDDFVTLTEVTSGYTMLAIMGPRSRDLLQTLTDADLSNQAFPFATAQEIDIAYARPLAIRMSFVGELGWELYIPAEFSNNVFDALMEQGEKFDLKPVGLHALDSLRLEKGYKHWSADITPDDTPFEAGLGFCVKLEKPDFIGKNVLVQQKESGLKRKLVMFSIEDPGPLVYHDEPIYRDGVLAGENTHGAYSHVNGCSIGMCWLKHPDGIDDAWIMDGKYEINVAGKMFPIKIHLEPVYDPKSNKVRM